MTDKKTVQTSHLDLISKLWPLAIALITGIAFFVDMQARLDLFQVKLDYTNTAIVKLSSKLDEIDNYYIKYSANEGKNDKT